MSEQEQHLPQETIARPVESASEARARRMMIVGLVILALLFIGMVALLAVLSTSAYNATMAGEGPTPGAVVVSLLRDVAIILVAFETVVIGALLALLTLQVQALVRMLRDEIQPMLASLNETVSTVRGTAQFMSESVVSPTIRAAGLLAGLRRVLAEAGSLVRPSGRRAHTDDEH